LQATTEKEGLYFARKFEPVVDLLVINKLESWIQDDVVNYKLHGHDSWDKHWENIFDRQDSQEPEEAKIVTYNALTRLSLDFIITLCKITHPTERMADRISDSTQVNNINLLMENNRFRGLLVHFTSCMEKSVSKKSLQMEAYVRPRPKFRLIRRLGPINRLVTMSVCSDFDVKEMFFRNFGCILGSMTSISLLHEWSISEDVMDDELMNFSVAFTWIDPNNKTVLQYEESIAFENPDATSSSSLLLQSIPNVKLPMKSGVWKVMMVYHEFIVAETSFLVIPTSLSEYPSTKGPKVTSQVYIKLTDETEESQILSFPEIAKEENTPFTEENEDKSFKIRSDSANSSFKSGFPREADIQKIDSLISSFWSVQEVCLIPEESEDSLQHRSHEYSSHDLQPRRENDLDGNEQLETPDQSKNTTEFPNEVDHPLEYQKHVEGEDVKESSRPEVVWICPVGRGDLKTNLELKPCSQTPWSSFSPDPKSEII
jgi:hypothetical protein